jgi:hypothetical protein
MTPLEIHPRQVGMLAAQHLAKTLADNPMATDPVNGLQATDPGHPWQDWRNGFIDTRILLHKLNRRALALGVGLVDLWRLAPAATRESLIEMGTKSGELICMAILAAMLESEETRYDLDDPHAVLAIFSGMKLRLTNRPPCCRHEPSLAIHDRAHNVAGALQILFTRPSEGQITLNVAALIGLMDSLVKLDADTRDQIASGKFQNDDHSDIP